MADDTQSGKRNMPKYGLKRVNGNLSQMEEMAGLRRESDEFLDQFIARITAEDDIDKSLMIVMESLKSRGFVSPRIYRYRTTQDECVLLKYLDLPEKFATMPPRFNVQHDRILREVINDGNLCYTPDIFEGIDGIIDENDPMHYIRESGLVGIPYTGSSKSYAKDIKGAIIFNYDPEKKLMDAREFRVLKRIGQFVGIQVSRLLDMRILEEKDRKLADANNEIREANKRLGEMAMTDALTGLYNRRKLDEDIEHYFSSALREGDHYIFMMDLDHFKITNDEHGHAWGDLALREVAAVLKAVEKDNERYNARAYRFGGEEFGLLIGKCEMDHVEGIARQIMAMVKNDSVCPHVDYGITIGISSHKDTFRDGEGWLEKADELLYHAKRTRDCCMFDDKVFNS